MELVNLTQSRVINLRNCLHQTGLQASMCYIFLINVRSGKGPPSLLWSVLLWTGGQGLYKKAKWQSLRVGQIVPFLSGAYSNFGLLVSAWVLILAFSNNGLWSESIIYIDRFPSQIALFKMFYHNIWKANDGSALDWMCAHTRVLVWRLRNRSSNLSGNWDAILTKCLTLALEPSGNTCLL